LSFLRLAQKSSRKDEGKKRKNKSPHAPPHPPLSYTCHLFVEGMPGDFACHPGIMILAIG